MFEHALVHIAPVQAPPPLNDSIHLWLLDISAANLLGTEDLHLVSADELARAENLAEGKHAFLHTRIFMRKVLSHYTQLAPQDVIFSKQEFGKPVIGNSVTPIHFNLSHSGNYAVLAVSKSPCIGVDLELKRPRAYAKIAQRYFHPIEIAQLKNCSTEQIQHTFFGLWTLKEAFFKARGKGIAATGLHNIGFSLTPIPQAIFMADALKENINDWQFFHSDITPQLCVSVASKQSAPLSIRWLTQI
jgi:4'-phosphopantetheinyl transferase